jgi:hypothetical protein
MPCPACASPFRQSSDSSTSGFASRGTAHSIASFSRCPAKRRYLRLRRDRSGIHEKSDHAFLSINATGKRGIESGADGCGFCCSRSYRRAGLCPRRWFATFEIPRLKRYKACAR